MNDFVHLNWNGSEYPQSIGLIEYCLTKDCLCLHIKNIVFVLYFSIIKMFAQFFLPRLAEWNKKETIIPLTDNLNHILDIKTEPLTEKPKWCLIAVSEAARKWRNRFELQPNQSYVVGRSRSNDIYLPSPFCSKKQCTLQVTADEVIMKDQVWFKFILLPK